MRIEWESFDEEEKPQRTTLDDKIDEKLLEEGIIVLHGELNETNCNSTARKLLYLESLGKKKIRMIMNSVGGEVYHGLLIYDTLEALKKKGIEVIVEARGVCASMGVVVLMGASKRVASKYTRFLLHEVSSWTYGKASEIQEESEELNRVNRMLDEIVANRSKITLKTLQKKTRKKEWWLSAEEALKLGLIDEIV